MLEIKKGSMTIIREKNDIKSCTPMADSIHIKFSDNTEVILMIDMDPRIRAIASKLDKIGADDVKVNFNDINNMLSIGNTNQTQ